MTYQEQYSKSKRLFSPTNYDQLEHLAQNTSTWRMATFNWRHGGREQGAGINVSFPPAAEQSAAWVRIPHFFKWFSFRWGQNPHLNILLLLFSPLPCLFVKTKQGLTHKDRSSRVWNTFKTTPGHFAHDYCKEVA